MLKRQKSTHFLLHIKPGSNMHQKEQEKNVCMKKIIKKLHRLLGPQLCLLSDSCSSFCGASSCRSAGRLSQHLWQMRSWRLPRLQSLAPRVRKENVKSYTFDCCNVVLTTTLDQRNALLYSPTPWAWLDSVDEQR